MAARYYHRHVKSYHHHVYQSIAIYLCNLEKQKNKARKKIHMELSQFSLHAKKMIHNIIYDSNPSPAGTEFRVEKKKIHEMESCHIGHRHPCLRKYIIKSWNNDIFMLRVT